MQPRPSSHQKLPTLKRKRPSLQAHENSSQINITYGKRRTLHPNPPSRLLPCKDLFQSSLLSEPIGSKMSATVPRQPVLCEPLPLEAEHYRGIAYHALLLARTDREVHKFSTQLRRECYENRLQHAETYREEKLKQVLQDVERLRSQLVWVQAMREMWWL